MQRKTRSVTPIIQSQKSNDIISNRTTANPTSRMKTKDSQDNITLPKIKSAQNPKQFKSPLKVSKFTIIKDKLNIEDIQQQDQYYYNNSYSQRKTVNKINTKVVSQSFNGKPNYSKSKEMKKIHSLIASKLIQKNLINNINTQDKILNKELTDSQNQEILKNQANLFDNISSVQQSTLRRNTRSKTDNQNLTSKQLQLQNDLIMDRLQQTTITSNLVQENTSKTQENQINNNTDLSRPDTGELNYQNYEIINKDLQGNSFLFVKKLSNQDINDFIEKRISIKKNYEKQQYNYILKITEELGIKNQQLLYQYESDLCNIINGDYPWRPIMYWLSNQFSYYNVETNEIVKRTQQFFDLKDKIQNNKKQAKRKELPYQELDILNTNHINQYITMKKNQVRMQTIKDVKQKIIYQQCEKATQDLKISGNTQTIQLCIEYVLLTVNPPNEKFISIKDDRQRKIMFLQVENNKIYESHPNLDKIFKKCQQTINNNYYPVKNIQKEQFQRFIKGGWVDPDIESTLEKYIEILDIKSVKDVQDKKEELWGEIKDYDRLWKPVRMVQSKQICFINKINGQIWERPPHLNKKYKIIPTMQFSDIEGLLNYGLNIQPQQEQLLVKMLEGQNIKCQDLKNLPKEKKQQYLQLMKTIIEHENVKKFKPIMGLIDKQIQFMNQENGEIKNNYPSLDELDDQIRTLNFDEHVIKKQEQSQQKSIDIKDFFGSDTPPKKQLNICTKSQPINLNSQTQFQNKHQQNVEDYINQKQIYIPAKIVTPEDIELYLQNKNMNEDKRNQIEKYYKYFKLYLHEEKVLFQQFLADLLAKPLPVNFKYCKQKFNDQKLIFLNQTTGQYQEYPPTFPSVQEQKNIYVVLPNKVEPKDIQSYYKETLKNKDLEQEIEKIFQILGLDVFEKIKYQQQIKKLFENQDYLENYERIMMLLSKEKLYQNKITKKVSQIPDTFNEIQQQFIFIEDITEQQIQNYVYGETLKNLIQYCPILEQAFPLQRKVFETYLKLAYQNDVENKYKRVEYLISKERYYVDTKNNNEKLEELPPNFPCGQGINPFIKILYTITKEDLQNFKEDNLIHEEKLYDLKLCKKEIVGNFKVELKKIQMNLSSQTYFINPITGQIFERYPKKDEEIQPQKKLFQYFLKKRKVLLKELAQFFYEQFELKYITPYKKYNTNSNYKQKKFKKVSKNSKFISKFQQQQNIQSKQNVKQLYVQNQNYSEFLQNYPNCGYLNPTNMRNNKNLKVQTSNNLFQKQNQELEQILSLQKQQEDKKQYIKQKRNTTSLPPTQKLQLIQNQEDSKSNNDKFTVFNQNNQLNDSQLIDINTKSTLNNNNTSSPIKKGTENENSIYNQNQNQSSLSQLGLSNYKRGILKRVTSVEQNNFNNGLKQRKSVKIDLNSNSNIKYEQYEPDSEPDLNKQDLKQKQKQDQDSQKQDKKDNKNNEINKKQQDSKKTENFTESQQQNENSQNKQLNVNTDNKQQLIKLESQKNNNSTSPIKQNKQSQNDISPTKLNKIQSQEQKQSQQQQKEIKLESPKIQGNQLEPFVKEDIENYCVKSKSSKLSHDKSYHIDKLFRCLSLDNYELQCCFQKLLQKILFDENSPKMERRELKNNIGFINNVTKEIQTTPLKFPTQTEQKKLQIVLPQITKEDLEQYLENNFINIGIEKKKCFDEMYDYLQIQHINDKIDFKSIIINSLQIPQKQWIRIRQLKQKNSQFQNSETKEIQDFPPNFPTKEQIQNGNIFVKLDEITKKDIEQYVFNPTSLTFQIQNRISQILGEVGLHEKQDLLIHYKILKKYIEKYDKSSIIPVKFLNEKKLIYYNESQKQKLDTLPQIELIKQKIKDNIFKFNETQKLNIQQSIENIYSLTFDGKNANPDFQIVNPVPNRYQITVGNDNNNDYKLLFCSETLEPHTIRQYRVYPTKIAGNIAFGLTHQNRDLIFKEDNIPQGTFMLQNDGQEIIKSKEINLAGQNDNNSLTFKRKNQIIVDINMIQQQITYDNQSSNIKKILNFQQPNVSQNNKQAPYTLGILMKSKNDSIKIGPTSTAPIHFVLIWDDPKVHLDFTLQCPCGSKVENIQKSCQKCMTIYHKQHTIGKNPFSHVFVDKYSQFDIEGKQWRYKVELFKDYSKNSQTNLDDKKKQTIFSVAVGYLDNNFQFQAQQINHGCIINDLKPNKFKYKYSYFQQQIEN